MRVKRPRFSELVRAAEEKEAESRNTIVGHNLAIRSSNCDKMWPLRSRWAHTESIFRHRVQIEHDRGVGDRARLPMSAESAVELIVGGEE